MHAPNHLEQYGCANYLDLVSLHVPTSARGRFLCNASLGVGAVYVYVEQKGHFVTCHCSGLLSILNCSLQFLVLSEIMQGVS